MNTDRDTNPRRRESRKIKSIVALCGTVVVTMSGGAMLASARGEDETVTTTLRVMASAVTIDATCRNVSVDYGALFRYGDSNNVAAAAIMPLGSLRAPFEAALGQAAKTAPEALCTAVVAQERDLVPGVIRTR